MWSVLREVVCWKLQAVILVEFLHEFHDAEDISPNNLDTIECGGVTTFEIFDKRSVSYWIYIQGL